MGTWTPHAASKKGRNSGAMGRRDPCPEDTGKGGFQRWGDPARGSAGHTTHAAVVVGCMGAWGPWCSTERGWTTQAGGPRAQGVTTGMGVNVSATRHGGWKCHGTGSGSGTLCVPGDGRSLHQTRGRRLRSRSSQQPGQGDPISEMPDDAYWGTLGIVSRDTICHGGW